MLYMHHAFNCMILVFMQTAPVSVQMLHSVLNGSNWVILCWVLGLGSRVKPVSSYSAQLVAWTTRLEEEEANRLMGRCLFDDNDTIACSTRFDHLA